MRQRLKSFSWTCDTAPPGCEVGERLRTSRYRPLAQEAAENQVAIAPVLRDLVIGQGFVHACGSPLAKSAPNSPRPGAVTQPKSYIISPRLPQAHVAVM